MEIKPREEIAIGLFTGSVIALFIIINDIVKFFYQKILVIFILIVLIAICLKVILDRKSDLHSFGDILRRLLNIKHS